MSTHLARERSRRIRERLTATRFCQCDVSGCKCYSPARNRKPTCEECSNGWHVNVEGQPFTGAKA